MDTLAKRWLSVQCSQITDAVSGFIFSGSAQGPVRPMAAWPDAATLSPEQEAAARQCIATGVSGERPVAQGWMITAPLAAPEGEGGCVLLTITDRSTANRHAVGRILQWGLGWLEMMLTERVQRRSESQLQRAVSDLLIEAMAAPNLDRMAYQLATSLAVSLNCMRVSLGVLQRGQIRIRGLSHQTRFDVRAQALRGLQAAMEEAADRQRVLSFPPVTEGAPTIPAHRALCVASAGAQVTSLPITHNGEVTGVLTLEHDIPLTESAQAACTTLVRGLSPLIGLRQQQERPLAERLMAQIRSGLSPLLGAGHLKTKVAALLAASLITYSAVAQQPYRVTAKAVLEGDVRQVVVAPLDGFIASAAVRAGDRVTQGSVMGALDDKALRLEQVKWVSQREQYLKEYNSALGSHDRAQVHILRAQIAQAEAQLNLLDQQLARLTFIAPIDGVVMSGDLTQALGAPVERGEQLFEISPLDQYRIVLKVAEEDIRQISPGQPGALRLAGLPDQPLAFRVDRVSPVLEPDEGGSFYRVEADLMDAPQALRPGMSGIGKIEAGSHSPGWIWFHGLLDRTGLWLWQHGG